MDVIILLATIKQRRPLNLVSSFSRIFSVGGIAGCRKFLTCSSGEASTAHAYSKFINLRLQILDILSIRLKYAFIMENLKGKKITTHQKSSVRLPCNSMYVVCHYFTHKTVLSKLMLVCTFVCFLCVLALFRRKPFL
jgi:hypothetical protein